MSVARIVNDIFYFYYILIILRIFLTWIPSINWQQQPFKWMREVSDAYLDIFRKIIPPAGGLDFSPIIAIIALNLIQGIVVGVISSVLG